MTTALPVSGAAAAASASETPSQRAERCHDELLRAAALLRVTASALDYREDAEDEACAVLQAVERVEAACEALEGAELISEAEWRARAA
ncbi:MAG: hypothetical protein MUF07_19095 [Steroidobacteraceae bacterium]|jgi:hypothetical protein|nr:hypothetical protein [Steroidobacteraceae bacterium]